MLNKLRTVIVDDEPWALDLIKSYIAKIDFLELVYATDNPAKMMNYLALEKADLLFLDIQMPEINGMDVMKILDTQIKIIVTTAYSEYAIQTYEHNVLDYLVKPIGFARFYKSAQRAADLIALTSQRHDINDTPRNFLFIKTDGKLVKVLFSEILFVEGLKDYISIQTTTDRIISLDSLAGIEKLLPEKMFCRIHKSFISSLPKIDSIVKNRVFIGQYVLPVGEVYKATFMQKVNG